ncbi:BPL-N domain-containing protein [Pirellulaceae bacterium]|jgi:glutamine amidotransferase-like uncharacterized protein|nr:BPL-N domain-containing protein [Pirellulaceae bacterium]
MELQSLSGNRLNPFRQWGCLIAVLFLAITPATGFQQTVQTGTLGKGKDWETSWHIRDSGEKGPVILVVGGLHGNEPAGWLAAEQVACWPIQRGKLIVLPAANRLGLTANIRWFPLHRNDKSLRDLNRNFPTKQRGGTVTEVAESIWDFVKGQKPDWVFDLHEGFDFHLINSKSVGSSVISFPAQKKFASQLVKRVNENLVPEKHFSLLAGSGPVNGSLARACGEVLGAKSFIFETTTKDQPISTRTRQHREMVSLALEQLGVIDASRIDQLVSLKKSSLTNVAIFDGPGANAKTLFNKLKTSKNLTLAHIGTHDVKDSIIKNFDVVIFPGGSGSKQGRALGPPKREMIRNYVRNGGGLIGICAGAYLCSSHYDWSLHMMNAKVFNINVDVPGVGRKSMWFRGPAANVQVEVFKIGQEKLGISGAHTVRYQNGPILSPDEYKDVPGYRVLAEFRTENGIYQAQEGTMIGAPAVVEATFGSGTVMAFSPHFESTNGLEKVIVNAIQVVRKK